MLKLSINSSSGGSSDPSVPWYFPLLSSSETQGQLEGAGKSLNEREKNSGEEKSRTRTLMESDHTVEWTPLTRTTALAFIVSNSY